MIDVSNGCAGGRHIAHMRSDHAARRVAGRPGPGLKRRAIPYSLKIK